MGFLRKIGRWGKSILKNRSQHDEIIKEFWTRLRKLTPQTVISNVEIHLAEHCNLNCFCCGHFSTIAEEEYADLFAYEKDMKQLALVTGGGIDCFRLMGGEPLLHPNCKEFFKITRTHFPQSAIKLVTNGILLPKQKEDFWEYAKEYKVIISPTKYPIKIDWQSIEKMCQKYEVPLIFYNNAKIEKTSWQFLLDKEGKQDVFYNFNHCWDANWCVRFHKGKLATCTGPISIEHLNKKFNQNFIVTPGDYIDIYKYKEYALPEITQFLARPIPFCRYCNKKESWDTGKWRLSEKTLEEYTQKYEDKH